MSLILDSFRVYISSALLQQLAFCKKKQVEEKKLKSFCESALETNYFQ